MADVSKCLGPGEHWQPAADALNGYQDAADYVRDLKEGGGAMPDPGVQRQVVIVTVKNRSGRDCARFDVLGISEPIFPPDDDPSAFTSRVGLSGVVPKLSDHATRFVVLLEPAAQNALARACLIGVVPVRLNVVYEWHQFAHLEDERADRLVSDSVGFLVVWKDAKANEDASGNRWALVKIGGPALTMGVWKNQGDPVGPHEHFCITGVDAGHAGMLVGTRPTSRFGPDYAVNGSQQVGDGQYGVYQRSGQVFVAYGGTPPEPGDQLGPVPGSGSVTKQYPPVCHVLGVVDGDHNIALAAPCRPVQRFKLLEPLYECGNADAQIMGRSGYSYITRGDYTTDSGGAPCDKCKTGTTPKRIILRVSGLQENSCGCCEALNRDWVLEQTVGLPCQYTFVGPPYCGGGETRITLYFYVNAVSGVFSAAFFDPEFGSPGKDCAYLSLWRLRPSNYDCTVDILGQMQINHVLSGGDGCNIDNVVAEIIGVEM